MNITKKILNKNKSPIRKQNTTLRQTDNSFIKPQEVVAAMKIEKNAVVKERLLAVEYMLKGGIF